MTDYPPTGRFNLHQTRALLAALGHSPRKPLGQNFLVDGNIVAKSLHLAGIAAGDVVVEIGPGLGTLTGALLAAGATVFAVERDPILAKNLRERLLPLYPEKFFLTKGDAMDSPLAGYPQSEFFKKNPGNFKIVANLPYAISTPWVDAVLEGVALPAAMVLMLQREAAERLTALPGGKDFGAISVTLDGAYERAPGHPVPAQCFFPPPRVESYLLHLRRRQTPRILKTDTRRAIRSLFLHRRKQLGSIVRHAENKPPALDTWLARLPEWGLDATARPETVPLPAWHALNEML